MARSPLDAGRANEVMARVRLTLASFTPGQKAVSALAVVGMVGAAFYFLTHGSGTSYQTLYANLQPAQAGQVTQKLTAAHVPYKLTDGGTTVEVPTADVNQERISLAEAGLPSGNTISFQTLASTGITSSEFVQNVDYQQALEGQLASTIESIAGVSTAQISLVLPDTNTFAIGNSQTPTASVLVGLAGGTTLTSEQVQGIVHLVASAVPGLTADNVTVVDSNGHVLSAPGVDTSADGDNAETVAYDNQLSQSLTSMVDQVVGQGNAAINVHATLDFNQQQTTTNGFQVGANGRPITVPTSQNTTNDNFTGTGAQASGVLGAGQPAAANNGNGTYTSTQNQTSNAVGQVTQTVQQAPGQVQRTDVAVLLNAKTTTPAQVTAIRNLVTTAAGLNLRGGDAITVSALPFSTVAKVTPPKPKAVSPLRRYGPDAGLVALIAVLFLLALRAARKRTRTFEEVPVGELAGPPTAVLPATATVAVPAPLADTAALPALSPAGSPVTTEVEEYIAESPDEVAMLMRNWAQERPAATGA